MTELRVCDGSFRAFLDPGFAGPRTTWRAVDVDDGSTWEACELGAVPERGVAEPPKGTQLVLDEAGHALVLARGTAGATLGELVDATAAQGARMDPSICVAIVCEVARSALGGPISSDHAVIGFDGSVLSRAHLPWWGPAPQSRVPPGLETFDATSEALHMLGELALEVFTSTRWPGPGLVLPTLPKALRRKARAQLRTLLEDTVVRQRTAADGDEWAYDEYPTINVVNVRDGLLALARTETPATPAELGALVQNVFADRWTREQRARAIIDAACASR